MRSLAPLLAGTVLTGLCTAAAAQQLPTTSPAQQRVNEINSSIARQQQSLQGSEQNQFEANQLRSEQSRQSVRSGPPIGVGGGRICPPGASGC